MLAQIKLALVLLDLDLGLPLHVLGYTRAPDFTLHPPKQELQALADVEALKNLVLVGDLEVQIGGGQIGEAPRIGDVHLEDCRHFVRNPLD